VTPTPRTSQTCSPRHGEGWGYPRKREDGEDRGEGESSPKSFSGLWPVTHEILGATLQRRLPGIQVDEETKRDVACRRRRRGPLTDIQGPIVVHFR
jgi:hypothetical protein